jgi:glyoxylase-like metal-dependent hydrolase (beta-lactamase superfamily II)
METLDMKFLSKLPTLDWHRPDRVLAHRAGRGGSLRGLVIGVLIATCVTTDMTAIAHAQAVTTQGRKGTVVVTDRGGVRIHTYVAPADGWLVNTQIVEGPHKLIIFDAQLLNPYAEEVAAYAESLHKPVDRIIISHGHPDHWSGLDVLTKHFPNVPIYALPGATAFITQKGDYLLTNLVRKNYGDLAASRVVAPNAVLKLGKTTIDGISFDFREYKDAESDDQLVALLPKQHVLMAFDTVFQPNDYIFTVSPYFDHWVTVLNSIKSIKGYDRIMIGHDEPTDAKAIDATINYLHTAKKVYGASADAKAYVQGVKAAFPDRQQPFWLEFSSGLLYSTPKQ